MKGAYYNEIDPFAAEWLKHLIAAGAIAPGDVDTRSIEDVASADLRDYTQHHFFAGIGGWSYALRLVGWPDDRPVWTGSCPCQPFSQSGKKGGFDDERHLWPAFDWLIGECRPSIIFGEQVASPDGLTWLDLVSSDLEGKGYAVASADLCAAGVGAPHIRQRLYWMAHADSSRRDRSGLCVRPDTRRWDTADIPAFTRSGSISRKREQQTDGSNLGGVAHADRERIRASGCGEDRGSTGGVQGTNGERQRLRPNIRSGSDSVSPVAHPAGERREMALLDNRGGDAPAGVGETDERRGGCTSGGVAYADGGHTGTQREQPGREHRQQPQDGSSRQLVADAHESRSQGWGERRNGRREFTTWACGLVDCRDGKRRPVEPGSFPLAHGVPGRVGLLRGYGNAIVPEAAATFIEATGLI